MQYFKEYLQHTRVTLVTDHRPIVSIMKKANLNAKLHRMVLAMQDINGEIEHRAGKDMVVPDCLSRLLDCRGIYDFEDGAQPEFGNMLSSFADDATEQLLKAKQQRCGAGWEHLRYMMGPKEAPGEAYEAFNQDRRALVRNLMYTG